MQLGQPKWIIERVVRCLLLLGFQALLYFACHNIRCGSCFTEKDVELQDLLRFLLDDHSMIHLFFELLCTILIALQSNRILDNSP